MSDLEREVQVLKTRVARLEAWLKVGATAASSTGATPATSSTAAPAGPPGAATAPRAMPQRLDVPMQSAQHVSPARKRASEHKDESPFFEPQRDPSELSVTQVMGWAGATLLVLAAAYLIRLVYDTGWLTPPRQIALAFLGGSTLIAAGLRLGRSERVGRDYASLLPAAGLVVFYLAIYGAHLYYHLISPSLALAAVVCNGLLALWLGRRFESELYALFSVAGSYSAPLLLRAGSGSVLDLAIYFTAWSVVFSLYALSLGRRRPYLLAGYLALVAFAVAWESLGRVHWGVAAVFQTLQFGVFVAAGIVFSVRHGQPMTHADAVAHLPLLVLFYGLQYALLDRFMPLYAPWLALASAAVLLMAYGVARRVMGVALEAGGFIVGAYSAMVLFHAVYLELLPEAWAPWVVALTLPFGAYMLLRSQADAGLLKPFKLLLVGLLVLNFARVMLLDDGVPHSLPLALVYTAELYGVYAFGRGQAALRTWRLLALYAAHLGGMSVVVRATDNALGVSMLWALLALITLVLAFRWADQDLGKSSLLVFSAALFKVILLDLADAAPLLRIGSLVAVGLSLYVGGLLYRRLVALPPAGAAST